MHSILTLAKQLPWIINGEDLIIVTAPIILKTHVCILILKFSKNRPPYIIISALM